LKTNGRGGSGKFNLQLNPGTSGKAIGGSNAKSSRKTKKNSEKLAGYD